MVLMFGSQFVATMDQASARGTHVAVYVPPLSGSPMLILEDCAHHEIHDTSTGEIVGTLPIACKMLSIQWPYVVAVHASSFELWQADESMVFNYMQKVDTVSIVDTQTVTFVGPSSFVAGWSLEDSEAWGLFTIESDGCKMQRSGTVRDVSSIKACSSVYILFAKECVTSAAPDNAPAGLMFLLANGVMLDNSVYVNMYTMQQTKTIARSDRLEMRQRDPVPWMPDVYSRSLGDNRQLVAQGEHCKFYVKGHTYTVGEKARQSSAELFIELDGNPLLRIKAPGISITPDMRYLIVRKTNSRGFGCTFEKRLVRLFDGCKGDRRVISNDPSRFQAHRKRLNAILSPVFSQSIIDDIFLCF